MKLIKRVVLWGMMLMITVAAVPGTALAASDTEMNIPVTGRIGNPVDTGDDTKPPEEPQSDSPDAGKKSSTASGVKTGDWTKYSSYLMLLGGAILLIILYIHKKKKNTGIIHYKKSMQKS